jgi:hypothetical protein
MRARLWPGSPSCIPLPMHNVQAVCIRQTLPCEVIGRSQVLLLGLFLLVCLPLAAGEECSGCRDDARKSRCTGVDLGLLPFEPLKKQHVRDAEKGQRHDGERTRDSHSRGGSNGRKWPSLRAYKARSTSAETPQIWGEKHRISASVKDFLLQLTNLNVLVAHLTSCNFYCRSLLCFAT